MSYDYNITSIGDSITGFELDGYTYAVQSCALNKNGNRLIVGFYPDDPVDVLAVPGIVRVYEYNGTAWIQFGNDIPDDPLTYPLSLNFTNGERNGHRVAINADGTIIASASYQHDSQKGTVRVYEYSAGLQFWELKGDLITGTDANENLGYSDVSLSDDGLVIAISSSIADPNGTNSGITRVYEWNQAGTDWTPRGDPFEGTFNNDSLGSSIQLNDDGSIIAIGAYQFDSTATDQGTVRVSQWNNVTTQWDSIGPSDGILGSTAFTSDFFGRQLAMNADGSRFVATNLTNNCFVYDYDSNTTTWTQTGNTISNLVSSIPNDYDVSMTNDGSIFASVNRYDNTTATEAGKVNIYEYVDNDWINIGNVTGINDYDQLEFVSLSDSGTKMAVASTNSTNITTGNVTGYVNVYTQYRPSIVSRYYIKRPSDTTFTNTTISIPFVHLNQQNQVLFLSSPPYDESLRYQIISPFSSELVSNLTLYANEYNSTSDIFTTNATITGSDVDYLSYANGTIMIQTTQNSGLLQGGSVPEYPIHYSVALGGSTTTYGTLIVSIENDSTVLSILDRIQYQIEERQTLKTEANRLMYERYEDITPALLRFHTMPFEYHTSSDSSVVRLDTEWNQRTGRYTTLIESTSALSESSQRPIQIVLPMNAPVDQVFPVVIYRKIRDNGSSEFVPNIEIGSVNSPFTPTQTIHTQTYVSPNLPVIVSGSNSYIVDTKALQFDVENEEWRLISRKPEQRTRIKQLIIKKDAHLQKHFLANDDEIQLSFNGVKLQALSLKGNQIQFVTAKQYMSTISNTDNTNRVKPSRYYSLNRDNLIQSMTGQEQFEDILGSGDVIRQTNVTNTFDATLSNLSIQDNQQIISSFGNGTATFGSNAYLLSSQQEWTQELPFQWNEWIQPDNNLTLYSPFTGISTDTQTMALSFIWNMKVSASSTYPEQPTLLSATYTLPNSTTDVPLDIGVEMAENTSVMNTYDLLVSVTNQDTTENTTTTVAHSLDTDQWNRIGLDIAATFDKSGSNWTLQNMYSRCVAYLIPDSILDGTQKVSLSKIYPSGSFYNETNLTESDITLSSIGTIDVENVTVVTGIGKKDNPNLSSTTNIYLDELEVYTTRPTLTNIIGGNMLANPYH